MAVGVILLYRTAVMGLVSLQSHVLCRPGLQYRLHVLLSNTKNELNLEVLAEDALKN